MCVDWGGGMAWHKVHMTCTWREHGLHVLCTRHGMVCGVVWSCTHMCMCANLCSGAWGIQVRSFLFFVFLFRVCVCAMCVCGLQACACVCICVCACMGMHCVCMCAVTCACVSYEDDCVHACMLCVFLCAHLLVH